MLEPSLQGDWCRVVAGSVIPSRQVRSHHESSSGPLHQPAAAVGTVRVSMKTPMIAIPSGDRRSLPAAQLAIHSVPDTAVRQALAESWTVPVDPARTIDWHWHCNAGPIGPAPPRAELASAGSGTEARATVTAPALAGPWPPGQPERPWDDS